MKPVLIIIVTYRRFDHFVRTFRNLKSTMPPGSHVLVMHNLSDQHGAAYTEQEVPYREFYLNTENVKDTTWVVLGNNRGWSHAMNMAFSTWPDWKEYEYVLESNNDVDYEPDWYDRSVEIMAKNPDYGVLGLWKHTHHGTVQDRGDSLVRDNAPACAWFFRSADLPKFLPFPEKGPTKTRGGNGEDVDMTHKIMATGMLIGAPKDDLAHHMDGYDLSGLGKDNEAYL